MRDRNKENIVVMSQQEIQIYAGDTGYIVIRQIDDVGDDCIIFIDPLHAETIANAIMAAAPNAKEFYKEWKEENDEHSA